MPDTTTTTIADQPAAAPAPAQLLAATVTDLHNDPIVVVTAAGREYRLPIDVARVFERTSRPIVQAVLIEAGRLLRRHAGYAPAGDWRREAAGAWSATLAEIPGRCETCLHGCQCGVSASSDGCKHYRCLFVTDRALANTCDGVEAITQSRRPRPPARSPRR